MNLTAATACTPSWALASPWSFSAASVCNVSRALLKACMVHALWTLASTYYLWSFALCFDKNFVKVTCLLPLGFMGRSAQHFQPVYPRPMWCQDERRSPPLWGNKLKMAIPTPQKTFWKWDLRALNGQNQASSSSHGQGELWSSSLAWKEKNMDT